eukprot:scaffold31924_cov22-Phaeocystis_antarctica.AAC.1
MSVAALNLSAKPGGMDEQLVQLPPGGLGLGLGLGHGRRTPRAHNRAQAGRQRARAPGHVLCAAHAGRPRRAGRAANPLPCYTPLLRWTPYRAGPLTALHPPTSPH